MHALGVTMTTARGEAPGKVILLGEHAAVYGYPTLAIPVHARSASATIELSAGGRIELIAEDIGERWQSGSGRSGRLGPLAEVAEAALRSLSSPQTGLKARLSSTIPVGCGMGSSASVAIALIRAIAAASGRSLAAEEIAQLAMISERGFHGNPSGIDAEVIARNEPVLFIKGKGAASVRLGQASFRFVVANSGIASSTASVVGDVGKAYRKMQARYNAIFSQMGDLAVIGRDALERGAADRLGPLMSRAHELLREIDVSSPKLDALVEAAMGAGALGAKLSGAGRGGNVIALLKSQADERSVRDALVGAGATDICVESLGLAAREGKP